MRNKSAVFQQKQIEMALSKINAKIADATDLSSQAKSNAEKSESLLASVQEDIEALYISLNSQQENL